MRCHASPWKLFGKCRSVNHPADRPGACCERDRAVARYRELVSELPLEDVAMAGVKLCNIGGCRACSPEKRAPVVFKVDEPGADLDWLTTYVTKPALAKQGYQWFSTAQWEPPTFVQRCSCAILRQGRVPEVAQEQHSTTIVPDTGRHDSSRRRHRTHFVHRVFGLREEIQSKHGRYAAETARLAGQATNAGNDKGLSRVSVALSGKRNERGGGVAAYDRCRVRMAADGIGKRAGTAAYIKPVSASGNLQPGDEVGRQSAAPPAHESIVARCSCPLIPNAGHFWSCCPRAREINCSVVLTLG